MSESPLQLAISPCPNDTFVFHAWVNGRLPDAPAVQARYADIDVLNGWAADDRADVVKISYAALPELLDRYALLPSGSALGYGCGPLVVTTGQHSSAAALAGRRVAVPGLRTTAYLLFRMWAARRVGELEIVVLPFDQIMPAVRDGQVDAGLIIHESRFTYPSYGLSCLADLGEWWEAETGLPIPLGAIVARRDRDPDAVARAIRASVEAAWADPSESRGYVLEHAQEMDPAVADAHIGLYVNRFTADLGDDGYAAIRALLDRAAGLGLVPALAGPLEAATARA